MARKRKKTKKPSKPLVGFDLPDSKTPREGADPSSTNSKRPVWSISLVDADGPWGRALVDEGDLWEEMLPKLSNYETMTWTEIERDKKRNHSVAVTSLIPEAQKRLVDLSIDDVEALFRFRLSGKRRLWGIRDREVFQILWWDPKHEICPSVGAGN